MGKYDNLDRDYFTEPAHLAELFETEEFQNLSTRTQKVIAVHLDDKEIIKKVMEEDITMCKAIRDMRREERREGLREGLLYALKNLMESSQLTAEQALDILKITGEERAVLKTLL